MRDNFFCEVVFAFLQGFLQKEGVKSVVFCGEFVVDDVTNVVLTDHV